MDITILKELKNSRGEIKTKIVRITNKVPSKGLKFDTVNTLYQELLLKYKASNITIVAKPLDGNFITLKSSSNLDDNLKHQSDKYYDSLPKAIKKRVCGIYYSVDISIQY